MSDNLRFALAALSAVFVVVDPLGAIPIFATITAEDPPARRRTVARRAATATFLVLALFAAAGSAVFQLLGVTLGGFKVSGGLLLVLMSVDMMRARPSPTRSTALRSSSGQRQRFRSPLLYSRSSDHRSVCVANAPQKAAGDSPS